ncbi:MAG: DUF1587 domain-containing protein, partial [Verrucomicrobiales bacterium]|nr:DUF1587 domain-containing protein [Verrucomicrobiales bacterium]
MPPFIVKPFLTALILIASFSATFSQEKSEPAGTADFAKIAPFLEQYCHKCHDADTMKGDLRLDSYETTAAVIRERKTWLKVLEQLETREMPTKNPLPSEAEYEAMIEWVDRAVNQLDWEKIKHPGHVTIPRLTKTEYNRTIRDLFGLAIQPGEDFFEDGEGKSGFNNDRDALFITASQMEKYFDAAERTVDALMALGGKPFRKKFEAEDMFMTETGSRTSPVDDEGAIGYILNRGQMTLYDSIDLPGDGFYKFKVRARSTTHGPTGGALRINDELTGEVQIGGRNPEVQEIVAFLPKGSHQMAWNINLPPQAQRKPGGKAKTERKKYTELPKNANDIVSEESAKNAPKIPRTNQENPALKKLLDSWDRTQVGVQRPFEWLRLHGKNGNPSELQRFHGYVTERSKPLAKIEREIAAQLGIEPEDLRRKINDANRATEADRARLLNLADFQII